MRKSAKALVLVFVALLGSLGLTIGAAFSAAFAFGATALIVPGTGTHDVLTDTKYRNNAANRYIDPAGVGCTSTDGCTIAGVDYPAEFFPFVIFNGWCPGLSCDTWNVSVNQGVTNLDDAVAPFKNPNTDDVIIFGYSQGGAVVSREMYNLAGLDQTTVKDHISVVTIGNINNPRGLFSRLGFLPTIPGLDISFGPQLPTNIGIRSTNYSFEYDPVGDAPSYWGNPLAMLNAVAAFEYVHGYYLVPDDDSTDVMPYGYDDNSLADAINNPDNRQTYQDATFVLIPQRGALPMYQPVLDIGDQLGVGSLVKPLVALVNPLTKLLVNLGYDRVTNPGIPQYLSILPFNPFTFNPITFPIQVVQAVVQGVQDALNGGASLDVADSQAPAMTSLARLASAKVADTPVVAPAEKSEKKAEVSTLAADTNTAVVDTTAADADAAAKSAAKKEAADKAAADKAAADKEAADKAEKDAADAAAAKEAAAAKDAKEAAEKADKEAAEKAVADKATEAADKARQEAADNAKAAATGDKPAATDTTPTATDSTAAADTDKAA